MLICNRFSVHVRPVARKPSPLMRQSQQNIVLMVVYLAILFVASMASRTLIPIDETRYTTVAWEMWLRGDLLVPYLNGATYSHKPPLLFWLFMLGWKLFGVNEWWPRLIPFLFSFGSMLLLQRLGRWLWPDREVYLYAPFILLGFTLWSFFSTAVMFDMMLAFFVLLSMFSAQCRDRLRGQKPGSCHHNRARRSDPGSVFGDRPGWRARHL